MANPDQCKTDETNWSGKSLIRNVYKTSIKSTLVVQKRNRRINYKLNISCSVSRSILIFRFAWMDIGYVTLIVLFLYCYSDYILLNLMATLLSLNKGRKAESS